MRPRTKERIKDNVKKGVNINTYNKYLFIFETVLFVAVVEEFIEIKMLALDINLYLNILLVMLLVGTSFTGLIFVLEPFLKGTITKVVRFSNSKIVRVVLHSVILFVLFLLYAFVYFGEKITPAISIGLNAG
ncbi:MAG: hypothetical protein GY861_09310 [bacterium]|nr:hypothetical protein [bacterium]